MSIIPAVLINQLYPREQVTLRRHTITINNYGKTVKTVLVSVDIIATFMPVPKERYKELGIDMLKTMWHVYSNTELKATDGEIVNAQPEDLIYRNSDVLEVLSLDYNTVYKTWHATAVSIR